MKFTVLISKGEEFLIGRIKEIPSVMTQGETINEVMENISDALSLYAQDSFESLPQDDQFIEDEIYGAIISTKELEFA
ncbi:MULTISPECIES: type II toxin-antitoxin system HicB family antitoxin [Dyadobacter]|jgi:predicted RNase H-like HicB family nuclease|uniref:Type II toxin-antitoxin system HicB family antitoxin n=1 Tax=Dyadobacter chenhuakuii TaxID=2909339 RepID=A0A9X1QA88_9BACT|nr:MULTISPECIES: type II toxin-antitoxin system HicB family antitoxin [Dyadobacter]MCF2494938.1 type II toxin-antitoxin system HicB family antitoxin [Dyadobacter chenhuakuii]MCF2498015.1 type II toxin-antitoxin system HicB family antitoxin [Dyadobacter chenhuakuii]MCF2518982.1 type II toxin-antitoxin system HicB family antitoxin [Dyadobacter sp. CY351]USJ31746.1 type II toxin-antitoxin system HicB family antitoxin [Dyadobacter chenhuakuii]